MENPLKITALGNAIVDILTYVDDSFLLTHNLNKSRMKLCNQHEQQLILDGIKDYTTVPGGSAANTCTALSMLDIETTFIGSIGQDHWGKQFLEGLANAGTNPLLSVNPHLPTATSVILVTPDSERTMNTHLGASTLIDQDLLSTIDLSSDCIFYVEGYMFDDKISRQIAIEAIDLAKTNNCVIALTLSDPDCVLRNKAEFKRIIPKVDYLFANEKEYLNLIGSNSAYANESIINQNSHLIAPITVITQSERGCTLFDNQQTYCLPAIIPDQLIDLTGAGDLFAAGMLYGISNKFNMQDSAKAGIKLATKVISNLGPRLTIDQVQSALKLNNV